MTPQVQLLRPSSSSDVEIGSSLRSLLYTFNAKETPSPQSVRAMIVTGASIHYLRFHWRQLLRRSEFAEATRTRRSEMPCRGGMRLKSDSSFELPGAVLPGKCII
jgi:hypothetical protein